MGVGGLLGSILCWDLFVFQEGSWWGFEGTEVLGASICLIGSLGSGVSRHIWRGAVASRASSSPCSSPRRAASSSGRFWVPHSLAPGAKPLLSCSHLDTSKGPCTSGTPMLHCRGPQLVPLTTLLNIAEPLLGPGFFLPYGPEVDHSGGISMGQEILRVQPMKTGSRVPPTQCLLLGQAQSEGHSLPP